MVALSNAVTGYPRWQGELAATPRAVSIALHEVRRAYNDQWVRSALILAFGYAVISIGTLFSSGNRLTTDTYLTFLGFIRWAALGVAAVMAGTALLDDAKKGALELYLSRSVTRWSYLAGKILAVVGFTFVTLFGPALIFYGAAFFVIDPLPGGWAWVILGAAGYSAIWAIVVSGLGLGVSCMLRSTRAATILIFAGVAGLGILVDLVLGTITKSETIRVLSPMSALDQQSTWLFNIEPPLDFPWWWGAIALAALAAVGWSLVWLRHPRIKGVE